MGLTNPINAKTVALLGFRIKYSVSLGGNMKKALRFFYALLAASVFMGCANDSSESSAVEIVTDFPSGTTVWEGSSKFYSDENGEWQSEPEGFIYAYFKGVVEGDQILITHEKNDSWDDDWSVFEMSGLYWNDHFTFGGSITNGEVGAWESGDYAGNRYVRPYTGTQTTAITLSKLDAKRVNSTGGITIWGTGFTVKKIVVVSDTVVTALDYDTGWTITDASTTYPVEFWYDVPIYDSDGSISEERLGALLKKDDDGYTDLISGTCTADYSSQKGTWRITKIDYSDSSSEIPSDVFTENAVFDVSWTATTLTLTLQSDSTKTYTFTAK